MGKRTIESVERALVAKRGWRHNGEVRASERPADSLVDGNVEFDTSLLAVPVSQQTNAEISKFIAMRFRERTFDNYEFSEPKAEKAEEPHTIELCETNKEIVSLYSKIEETLKRMTDFGADGFV